MLEMCSYVAEIGLDLLFQLAHGTSCNLIYFDFLLELNPTPIVIAP
jgi:hypothetical protein